MDVRTPIPTNGGDWQGRFKDGWSEQLAQLKARFAADIVETHVPPEYATDVPIVFVRPQGLVSILKFMRSEPGFEYGFLADLTAVDHHPDEPRFEVVYNLYSLARKWRIRVKVRVNEGESVPSAITVWPGANWAEREVWDMFGIKFAGHPDLRRILMDERWEGHPLRKDYPLRGYQIYPTPEQVKPELLE
ncbi:MAG: NADH-quinone oxidoreductase subunit C [Bdellovibrionales bacterium]|nr:NADH-quinone oxidoreductase subunit C [Bdellovibrionales bacterium]